MDREKYRVRFNSCMVTYLFRHLPNCTYGITTTRWQGRSNRRRYFDPIQQYLVSPIQQVK